MKQHKSFELVKLDNNKMFLICKTYEKIPEFYLEVEKVLNELKFDGYVYFDKLSFTHNKDDSLKFVSQNIHLFEHLAKLLKVIKHLKK